MNVMKSTLSVSVRALLLAALLSAPQFVSAQQNPGGRPALPGAPTGARAASGRIIGTVTDATSGKPVSYATVAVLDAATGKVVSGGVAGDDGKVVLPGIPVGTYTVQASFVGYKNEERSGVAVAAGGTVDLGKISLATSAQKLGEVVVTGQKALIEEKVDRTVYNAENDQTTRGGDATDVLKRVPLLSVDLDGNVSLRGSSNIRVLINNKPSTIAASKAKFADGEFRLARGRAQRNGGSSNARSFRECSRAPPSRRRSTAAMPIWRCSLIAPS